MFTRIVILLVCIIATSINVFAADEIYCGVQGQQQQTQIGGYNVTSSGTVKALFIFIDFPDDNIDPTNTTWPVGSGPNYLNAIVDQTENQNSGTYANVTTFFNDQSFGQFKMIGNSYYVQAPHSLSWYITNHPGSENHYSAMDAIQILDQSVNFSDFDRWIDAPYSHSLGTDGILDMVFICYRQWYISPGILYGSSFIAEGWYGASLPSDVYVDGGTRRIVSSHALNVLNMVTYPDWGRSVQNVLHEFGHAWGLNHQYGAGTWAIMGQRSPSTSSFMSVLEREQLGWVNYNTITTTTTFTLPDFGSTGTAYRVQIPGTSEYYLLENHQKLTTYDAPDLTSGGQGLYILHNASGIASPNEGNLKIITADGRWTWNNPSWAIFPGTTVSVPVFQRAAVSRFNGKSVRDMHYAVNPANGQGSYNLFLAWLDENTGQLTFGGRYKGDGKASWNLTNNTVFSPYSNPAATKSNNTTTPVVIEVQGQSGSVLTVKVYINDTLSSAPSKPQDMKVATIFTSGDHYPKLTWTANVDPDLTGYEIWKRVFNGSNWNSYSLATTVGSGTTQWIDYASWGAGGGTKISEYKIRATDNQSKVSTFTEPKQMAWGIFIADKFGAPIVKLTPDEYSLRQNYPNPFNPVTQISYTLPEQSIVTVSIFDRLGREVVILENADKPAGEYTLAFDARHLASGTYFYKVSAGKYSATKKMLLLK